jgi:hypothetical protein
MKQTLLSFLLMLAFFCNANSQNQPDPLQGHYNLGTDDEIVVFSNHIYKDTVVKHNIFSYYGNSGQYFIDSSSSGTYDGNLSTGYYDDFSADYIETLTGDFNRDGKDNIVAAWVGSNNAINIIVPKVDRNTLTWNDQNSLKINNALPDHPNSSSVRFRLVKGFFESTPEPDFILAYCDRNGDVQIKIFNIDPNTLVPVEKASISDEHLNYTLGGDYIYDLTTGDFNGDGKDEIVLAGYDEQSSSSWSIFTKVYEVTDNNGVLTIVPKVRKSDYYTSSDFPYVSYKVNKMVITTGDFEGNTLDQFALDLALYKSSSTTYNRLLPASVSMGLDTINVDKSKIASIFQTSGTSYIGISAVSGDVNNDGKDELVLDGDGRIRIYSFGDSLQLGGYKEIDVPRNSVDKNNRRLVLADLNANPSDSLWNPEVIVTSVISGSGYSSLNIDVYEPVVDAAHNILSLNHRASFMADSTGPYTDYDWAVAAGDFNGSGIRLGKPRYFQATNIVQPLVILNAPPTHFDVFNDTTFDVNKSYNGQTSDFYSEYYTSSESEISMESELHKGWSVGASVEGGFSIPIVDVGVKIKIESDYGKNFSKQKYSSHTYKVSQDISASNDDFIYATIVDYDCWEYPIMVGDSVKGYTMVVSPGTPQQTWFPSKSPQAEEYLPDHEVGNILSYNQIAAPSDNSTLKTSVKWNTSDAITLDGSPGFQYNWSLENSNKTEETIQNEVNFHLGSSVSFDVPFKFIPNGEIHGDYNTSTMSTRTNTVTYTKGLDVHLGPIDLGIGETYYTVTPYAYWAKSGALVLDYAVNPRPSGINVPETWWQLRYGSKPDPALILPWRLDPEKGYNISSDKREETKEILFNPDNPNPGDTVNIQTRIHNFSLLNTSGPVEARFYMGDPSNGGVLIHNLSGQTTFSTSDFIKARGSKIISFDWQVPLNAPSYSRIYVVLDPDNKIDEIHKSNNIGWKVLNIQGSATAVDNERDTRISSFELSQNYPNPFNPTTFIDYALPKSSFVTLKVYDILGREVKTLVNKQMPAGHFRVQFDGSNLASGVYFYRINTGDFIQTKKLILLK